MPSCDTSCVRAVQCRLTATSSASWSFSFNSILTNPARSSNKETVEITKLTKFSEVQKPRLDLETAILLIRQSKQYKRSLSEKFVIAGGSERWGTGMVTICRSHHATCHAIASYRKVRRICRLLSSSLLYVKQDIFAVANTICTEIFFIPYKRLAESVY